MPSDLPYGSAPNLPGMGIFAVAEAERVLGDARELAIPGRLWRGSRSVDRHLDDVNRAAVVARGRDVLREAFADGFALATHPHGGGFTGHVEETPSAA